VCPAGDAWRLRIAQSGAPRRPRPPGRPPAAAAGGPLCAASFRNRRKSGERLRSGRYVNFREKPLHPPYQPLPLQAIGLRIRGTRGRRAMRPVLRRAGGPAGAPGSRAAR
jgi:hypothetical protein